MSDRFEDLVKAVKAYGDGRSAVAISTAAMYELVVGVRDAKRELKYLSSQTAPSQERHDENCRLVDEVLG